MSIKFRLTILYTFILIVVLLLFGASVYLISRTILIREVDRSLAGVAYQLREETKAVVMGDLTVLSVPKEELDVFQSAMNFFVILDAGGEILLRSENLADYNVMLDPGGPRSDEYFSTVVHEGRPLRVITEPLYVEREQGRVLVGYLQVARALDAQSLLDQLQLIMMLTGVAAVCLSLFLGAMLTHHLLKPLDDIAGVALRITRADDLGRRLPDTGRRDEIGRLTLVLNQTLERLERLFHVRQRFLADVSHELRTPLTTIRGNVDLMRRMEEAKPELLDVVQDELERMTRLVDDLLLLARADAGGLPIQRQPVELDNVFLDVYRQIKAMGQPVAVELQEVDQVCVLGDGDRLKQLIINLVDNAIKYTPDGGTVTLSLSKSDGLAEIQVRDTGIGIPREDLPRIFDRFYRVDKARSRKLGGSGLGLSIAQWIARAHGGDIRVNSEVGIGSVFRITMPVYQKSGEREINGQPIRRSSRPPLLEPTSQI